MKKMLALILAVGMCMTVLFSGCGGSSSGSSSSSSAETAAESAESDETAESGDESSQAAELDAQHYSYDYDPSEYVELGEYKGLNYTIVDTSVTDDEVEEEISYTLESYATTEQITDRAAEEGDVVNIDYVGKIDGEEFDGGSSSGTTATLGAGRFIDGFEDGIIGVTPGETVSLDLTFPEDYSSEDLAGKDVTFEITLNYIEGEDIIPELNDEFVAGLAIDDVETADAYREYVKNNLQEEKEESAESQKQQELMDAVVSNATIKDYPQELVDKYAEEYKDYFVSYAEQMGIEIAEFLEQYGMYLGSSATTEDELDTEAQDYGKEAAGSLMVFAAVAAAENFEITDEVYNAWIEQTIADFGFESADEIEGEYGTRYLKQIIINEYVLDVLLDNAVGVEAAEEETEE